MSLESLIIHCLKQDAPKLVNWVDSILQPAKPEPEPETPKETPEREAPYYHFGRGYRQGREDARHRAEKAGVSKYPYSERSVVDAAIAFIENYGQGPALALTQQRLYNAVKNLQAVRARDDKWEAAKTPPTPTQHTHAASSYTEGYWKGVDDGRRYAKRTA